jgi:hypothetical protein
MYMGSFDGSDPIEANYSSIKIWSQALDIAEVMNESRFIRPLRTLNSYNAVTCEGPIGANNHTKDITGNGRNWTASGAGMTSEHGPPVTYRQGRRRRPMRYAGSQSDEAVSTSSKLLVPLSIMG